MPRPRLWDTFRHPVPPETRSNLLRLWAGLPDSLRTPEQLFGRQWEGCGATLGAMPRCDFACTACYLGAEANRIPPATLAELGEQLRLIRAHVGWRGNVQLTDGEVSLRPIHEVVQLVRTALELELIPMLMTHGDTFRRDPGLLERLVVEGGLSEVSFHVDTTQRGRAGYPRAASETELAPVRAELAEIVRAIRRRTGHELRVASTVTVTRSNLEGVPEIVRWMLENNDVFRVLSFQPVAQVGRTRERSGVSRHELWQRIAAGLGEDMEHPASAWKSAQLFGHHGCSHVVMGGVWRVPGRRPRFVPLRDPTDPRMEADIAAFYERFGGLSFRADGPAEAAARVLGVLASAPGWWVSRGPGWLRRWLGRLEPGQALRALRLLASARARLGGLALVSHHFMDETELETAEGREREAACVFRVPFRGELVSMCRINAAGLRQAHYQDLARRKPAPSALPGAPRT